MAVPVRRDLLAQTSDLERRYLRTFSRNIDDRRRHLNQLARVLPRADQLFAGPRQRLGIAGERLGHALRRNLQTHREALLEASAHLRPRALSERITVCGERTKTLGQRMTQAQSVRLDALRSSLDGLDRVLESVSYRSVLDRGFALVRGADGRLHRRAAGVTTGEALTIAFTDGEIAATAGEPGAVTPPRRPPEPRPRPAAKPKPTSGNQGSLF
jgi:exodeoxyribonuclease VII large subunit